MQASEFSARVRRTISASCAAAFCFSFLPPAGLAVESLLLTPAALPSPAMEMAEPESLAQRTRKSNSRFSRSSFRRGRNNRPAGGSRYRLGAGSGSLTRPAPGFGRGNRRPTGGWVNRSPSGNLRPVYRAGRPGSNRPGSNPPNWNRPGWNRRDWVFRRPVYINTINVRPRWWGPGWSSARPWRHGWYNSGYSRWGWWKRSSKLWGITALTSAAIIGAAINEAISRDSPTIVVKDSPYRLIFGSVNAVNDDEVMFSFLFDNSSYQATANCQRGTLNDYEPDNLEESQLLNTACQVAFSNF